MSTPRDRPQQRSAILVTPDVQLRKRVAARLEHLNWTVQQASAGAEALALLNGTPPEAMIVDHWLPDLQTGEFLEYVAGLCPITDLLHMDGDANTPGQGRSMRRNELVHALRNAADEVLNLQEIGGEISALDADFLASQETKTTPTVPTVVNPQVSLTNEQATDTAAAKAADLPQPVALLPDVVGNSLVMQELSRLVRLVAPHTATALVLGETGTGKELVAKAVHRLSTRAAKPFMVLNCAAIPEQLLEAELFGHTRGAFTGAVTSRMGRIEAAHGGTLFLDEIGEMPIALQAKMLRFLESGEVQRVGDNDTARVDVRIVAATHQPLLAHAQQNRFRLDLYHRLAVFPVEIPPLRERAEDIPMLISYLLGTQEVSGERRSMTRSAVERLCDYSWQGNVRELAHVMQRAMIMAGDSPLITVEHLRLRGSSRS